MEATVQESFQHTEELQPSGSSIEYSKNPVKGQKGFAGECFFHHLKSETEYVHSTKKDE